MAVSRSIRLGCQRGSREQRELGDQRRLFPPYFHVGFYRFKEEETIPTKQLVRYFDHRGSGL